MGYGYVTCITGGVSEVNEWDRVREHALQEGFLRLMNGIGLGDMHYRRGF